jgi:hypothetical protein
VVARHRTQDQGRQGARDKKRGKNPLEKGRVNPRAPKQTRGGGGPEQPLPKNKKTSIPVIAGIEDCTRLTWSSSRRPGRVSRPSVQLTGRSSGSWIVLLPAPSRGFAPSVAYSRFRPQLQRRDRDGFTPSSLLTDRTYKCFLFIPFSPGCQGKSPGFGGRQRCSAPPPGIGPPGRTWPGAETRCEGHAGDSSFQNAPCPWPG